MAVVLNKVACIKCCACSNAAACSNKITRQLGQDKKEKNVDAVSAGMTISPWETAAHLSTVNVMCVSVFFTRSRVTVVTGLRRVYFYCVVLHHDCDQFFKT